MYVYMCVYMLTYMCIYAYTHMHIYKYTHDDDDTLAAGPVRGEGLLLCWERGHMLQQPDSPAQSVMELVL